MTVLMYHEVTDQSEWLAAERHIDPSYCLLPGQFADQMAVLAEHPQWRVVSTDRLMAFGRLDVPSVAVTFDDGLAGNFRFAADILQRHHIPATFFVTVGKIGTMRYMSWPELKSLHKQGFTIASHTMTHPMLAYCEQPVLVSELCDSRKILEDQLGTEVNMISLPFGSWNDRVIKTAAEAGYHALFTSELDAYWWDHGIACFGRIPIRDSYSVNDFISLMDPDSMLTRQLHKSAWIKKGIKKMIGLALYRRLYRMKYRVILDETS